MTIKLYPHQLQAVRDLSNGKVLWGGVGTGKSITALAYYYTKVAGGELGVNGVGEARGKMKHPRDIYIFTTAKKRDSLEWEKDAAHFAISKDPENSMQGVKLVVDSWNNIKKYVELKDAFVIFDEQRLVGSGAWVKSFYKIARRNQWIVLSATPGDVWMDYVPIFVANGFYKNKTEFTRHHVVYNTYANYPKIDRYVETGRLQKYRRDILVEMPYMSHTKRHVLIEPVEYDKGLYDTVTKWRWNPWEERPIQDAAELFRCMRQVANQDTSRLDAIEELHKKHPKLIIFYNFNYELELLRWLARDLGVSTAEWNGQKHEEVPTGEDSWLYLVNYTAGAEGWNCVETDAMIFYSLSYSYKMFEQAQGRIDRLNTEFTDLYYYVLRSAASIDLMVWKSILGKKNFNESAYSEQVW